MPRTLARMSTSKRVIVAAPRGYCAGVDRAVTTVEKALETYGPPVYVRKQIVHNKHVVSTLEKRGAIFVDELDEVPADALVVFSAHGVSPAVREEAARRELRTIDATCPLVTKVHREAKRFAAKETDILLIGHAGHEEVEGTMGEAPDRTTLLESPDDVDRLDLGGHHRQGLRSGQRGHQVRAGAQPVGGRDPGEARAVTEVGTDSGAGGGLGEAHRNVLAPPRRGPPAHRRARRQDRPPRKRLCAAILCVLPGQAGQRRGHDCGEGDQDTHRVARQADDRHPPAVVGQDPAVPLGLARLHGHLDEVQMHRCALALVRVRQHRQGIEGPR